MRWQRVVGTAGYQKCGADCIVVSEDGRQGEGKGEGEVDRRRLVPASC